MQPDDDLLELLDEQTPAVQRARARWEEQERRENAIVQSIFLLFVILIIGALFALDALGWITIS